MGVIEEGGPAPPHVPGFELGRLVARGGTAEVWEGVRAADGRRVAVKVARAEHAAVEAALREAGLSAAAADAHVVPVQACLPLADGRVALVMPVLRGGDLAALVRARGHLAPGEVVTVLAPVAGAVGRLHRVGAVHGDLSPGNVLLDLDGRPSVADLGLGRVVGDEPAAVWGTEGYVAPEVLMGADPAPAADVYALGALGWLCLTGAPPGPPGLRPGLATLCRAGEGSEHLVEVLESAVSPHAHDRPGADALAWALFEAAEAEPLHLVEGDDEVSAVTYRLRAAAVRPPEPLVGRRRGRHARRRRVDLRSVPWRRGLVAVALVVLAGGGAAVAAAPAGTPGESAVPRPVVSPTPPDASGAADASTGATASVGRPAEAEVVSRRDAAGRRPAPLLTALADARALAWRRGDPALLATAEAPGSTLLARDTAAVAQLAGAGLRYAGLRYTVADVTAVTTSPTRAVLRARLGTSHYEVAGAGTSRRRPAAVGEEVLVDLAWTDDGWRLTAIRPPG